MAPDSLVYGDMAPGSSNARASRRVEVPAPIPPPVPEAAPAVAAEPEPASAGELTPRSPAPGKKGRRG